MFQKISGREKFFMNKRREGVSRYSVESFLSHCTKIFHWRTLWCFRKFLSSKVFMHRRVGASRFCRIFLSHRTETKSFVMEPFCFPESFCYRKKLWIREGLSRSSDEGFMSHSAEKFCKRIPLFSEKICGLEKFYG